MSTLEQAVDQDAINAAVEAIKTASNLEELDDATLKEGAKALSESLSIELEELTAQNSEVIARYEELIALLKDQELLPETPTQDELDLQTHLEQNLDVLNKYMELKKQLEAAEYIQRNGLVEN